MLAQDTTEPVIPKEPVAGERRRRHQRDCAVTHRPALQAAAAQLREADHGGQTWLAALGTWDALRILHAVPGTETLRGGTRQLSQALGMSRTTWTVHVRLLERAGLLQLQNGRWQLAGVAQLEGRRRGGGLAPNHLHTFRSVYRLAVGHLRDADGTGRKWRSALGAWVLLRHVQARWQTGEIPMGSGAAVARWLGVDEATWARWEQLLVDANLLMRRGGPSHRPTAYESPWVIPGWGELEGLVVEDDERVERGNGAVSSVAGGPEFRVPDEAGGPQFQVSVVQSFGSSPHMENAGAKPETQALQTEAPAARSSAVAARSGGHGPGRDAAGGGYANDDDPLERATALIAQRVPAEVRGRVLAHRHLRRRLDAAAADIGCSPERIAEAMTRQGWRGCGDVIGVLVGRRLDDATEALADEVRRRRATVEDVDRQEQKRARDDARQRWAEGWRAALSAAVDHGQLADLVQTMRIQLPEHAHNKFTLRSYLVSAAIVAVTHGHQVNAQAIHTAITTYWSEVVEWDKLAADPDPGNWLPPPMAAGRSEDLGARIGQLLESGAVAL